MRTTIPHGFAVESVAPTMHPPRFSQNTEPFRLDGIDERSSHSVPGLFTVAILRSHQWL
jgi:hypothetical protein